MRALGGTAGGARFAGPHRPGGGGEGKIATSVFCSKMPTMEGWAGRRERRSAGSAQCETSPQTSNLPSRMRNGSMDARHQETQESDRNAFFARLSSFFLGAPN